MTELTNVDFRKEGGLTKIVFEYSEPFARKVYYSSSKGDSEMLDKTREIESNILKEGFALKKKSFSYPEHEYDFNIEKYYATKRFKIYERSHESIIDGCAFVGCSFDMQNLESKNSLHINFAVVHPDKKYFVDNPYLYLNREPFSENIHLPFNAEVAGNIINEVLFISDKHNDILKTKPFIIKETGSKMAPILY